MAQNDGVIQMVRRINDKETILIELQGSLEHTLEKDFNNMYLGKFEQVDDVSYTLTIGNHILTGKRSKLKDPFLLCSKVKKNSNKEEENKIHIINVIKEKICFNLRPTPILVK